MSFDDGAVQVVDCKLFLSHSHHPDMRAYLDVAHFATFHIEYGELVWGDCEPCFPVIDLYRNQVDMSVSLEAAA